MSRKKALDERENHLKEDVDRICGDNKGKPSDVLYLNVGGTVMHVSRQTLTQVEGSMLASLFSGRWDDNIPRDREGNLFVDQPPEFFVVLIEYFRYKLCEVPNSPKVLSPKLPDFADNKEKYIAFLRMVEYYGLTPGVYPCILRLYSGLPTNCTITEYPNLGATVNESSVLTLVGEGHDRSVLSFEVQIGDVEDMQIGWLNPDYWNENTDATTTMMVGKHDDSFSLDLYLSGFLCDGEFSQLNGFTVSKGDVVRCERVLFQDKGFTWLVNGTVIPNKIRRYDSGDHVAAISGKGQWWVTKVDLDYRAG